MSNCACGDRQNSAPNVVHSCAEVAIKAVPAEKVHLARERGGVRVAAEASRIRESNTVNHTRSWTDSEFAFVSRIEMRDITAFAAREFQAANLCVTSTPNGFIWGSTKGV